LKRIIMIVLFSAVALSSLPLPLTSLVRRFYAAAEARGYPGWALLITIINVVYNLYPIWLQQYISDCG
jgi:uncharacterized membrane protein YhaH (DUF805 family)